MGKRRKELGKDKYGVQKTMRAADYLGDGIGQLALTIINIMIGQLTYFYTEKAGMSAAMVGTAILVPKIVDAFSDLIMGKIMDNTNSDKGKCRPWFLRMAIPAAINIILLFTIPKGISPVIQVIYIFVTNTLISAVVYTAIAVPFSSIIATRTQSPEERGNMGIMRTVFNMGGGMVLSIVIIPFTNLLGGDQKAWIIFAVIAAAVAAISLLIAYKTAKETPTQDGHVVNDNQEEIKEAEEEKVSFKDGLMYLFKNKFWVIVVLTSVISSINYGISNGSGVYYAKYILGDDNFVAVMSSVAMLPTIFGLLIIQPIIKKFGMRNTAVASFVIGVAGCIIRALFPYNLTACLVGLVLSGFAMMPFMCIQGPMLNNCVEYNEWKFGVRLIGMTNSANSFAGKISGAVGAALIGWILALFGYMAGVPAQAQPASVQTGVLAFSIYLPLILYIIMIVLLMMYTLERDYNKIITDLNERRK